MQRTCRWAGEIKKNTHPKKITALLREQAGQMMSPIARPPLKDKVISQFVDHVLNFSSQCVTLAVKHQL